MVTERTPLLPASTSNQYPERLVDESTAENDVHAVALSPLPREHYLDNLRALLTVLLVFYHGVVETIRRLYYHPRHFLSLSLFSRVAFTAFVAPAFFLLSGRAAALQLNANTTQANPDRTFFKKRTFRILLPAILHAIIGQGILVAYFMSWSHIFGTYKNSWTWARWSGPILYVFFVVLFDYVYLLARYMKRRTRSSGVERWITGGISTANNAMLWVLISAVVTATIVYTFLQCRGHGIYPWSLMLFLSEESYDSPTPDAPLSMVWAYIAGVYLEEVEAKVFLFFKPSSSSVPPIFCPTYTDIETSETVTQRAIIVAVPESAPPPIPSSSQPRYCTALHPLLLWSLFFLSLSVTTFSLALAQSLSPSILLFLYRNSSWPFVDGGFNAHTAFYVLWSLLTHFTIPILLILAFKSTGWTNRSWGLIVRRTYAQTYFHFIPILIAVYILRDIDTGRYLLLKAVLVGLAGVIGSWFIVSPLLLYDVVKQACGGWSGRWQRRLAICVVALVYTLVICIAPWL